MALLSRWLSPIRICFNFLLRLCGYLIRWATTIGHYPEACRRILLEFIEGQLAIVLYCAWILPLQGVTRLLREHLLRFNQFVVTRMLA